MTEAVLIAILTAFGTVLIVFIKWALKNFGDNSDEHTEISNRLVKLETILALFGEKVAKILHSPHTPELDRLLERYWNLHYSLTDAEWLRLREICEQIEADPTQPADKRTLAGFISTLTYHKMRLDAPQPKKHE